MKAVMAGELEREDYAVIQEPLLPPNPRLSWASYRPDVLGYRGSADEEQVAVVECETRPNMKRFAKKNHSSLWFQPFLHRRGTVRRILAVPQGRLRAVDMRLRGEWEVWVLGDSRPICRIDRLGVSPRLSDQPGQTRDLSAAASPAKQILRLNGGVG
jgi:hypothetical protein